MRFLRSGLSASCYALSSNRFLPNPRALLLVTEVIHVWHLIVEGFLLQLAPLQIKWIHWILSVPLQGLCLTMILSSAFAWCSTQQCQDMTKHQRITRNQGNLQKVRTLLMLDQLAQLKRFLRHQQNSTQEVRELTEYNSVILLTMRMTVQYA